jgi:flagellar capping protein FliD
MTTLETFQAYEQTKAAVTKLQADLEAALSKQEELKAALRSELGIEAAPTKRPGMLRKRAPRSLESILMTACGRKMKEAKEAGTAKKAALNAALDQAEVIAKGRNETVTEEMKAALTKKADELFGAKK